MNAADIDACLDDRPADGVFRLRGKVFADAQLFALEQTHIFERTWAFLGIESQLRLPNDFLTTFIGKVPVLVARNAQGRLGAFQNLCRHKGALVARAEHGNKRFWVCPYHGWTYDTAGKNVLVKDQEAGAYPPDFAQLNHDLVPLARFDNYRGLLFGSLNPDVPPLGDFLGEIRPLIDLAMEQGPQGMEFVPGRIAYTYDANWKVQSDNGSDGYHLTSTHPSLMTVVERREAARHGNLEARQFDWRKRFTQSAGMFTFRHGHTAMWMNQGQPENKPIHKSIDEVRTRLGKLRADWMLKGRNLTIFPNLQIADSTSLLIRTFRPLAVNQTEMRVWCMAPIGEDPQVRTWRMRQFEDFFNVTGLATPDDTAMYESAQLGFGAQQMEWLQGYERGTTAIVQGPNDHARELGITPVASNEGPYKLQSEVCLHATYREWARLMKAGLGGTPAYPGSA